MQTTGVSSCFDSVASTDVIEYLACEPARLISTNFPNMADVNNIPWTRSKSGARSAHWLNENMNDYRCLAEERFGARTLKH